MRNRAGTALTLALALLVGTCAACGTSPPPKQPPSQAALAAQLEGRAVALVQPSPEGALPYCTGVWVAQEAILTANHCVARLGVGDTVAYATRADVRGDDADGARSGVLAARDEAHDLALVKATGAAGHGVAQVSDPVVGQNAFTMGHPLGLWWSYSLGQVAAIRWKAFGDGEAMWWVQATSPVSPGNSGGGLFDENGNLIGICHGVLTRGEMLNFFIHPKYIREFLSSAGVEPARAE